MDQNLQPEMRRRRMKRGPELGRCWPLLLLRSPALWLETQGVLSPLQPAALGIEKQMQEFLSGACRKWLCNSLSWAH